MFCRLESGETSIFGVILYYSDPFYTDYEVKPPSVNAREYLEQRGAYLEDIPFIFVHRGETQYLVKKGYVSVTKGDFAFDDTLNVFSIHPEDHLTDSLEVLKRAAKCGFPTPTSDVYVLEKKNISKQKFKNVAALDKFWVAGFIQSRIQVTNYVLHYMTDPNLFPLTKPTEANINGEDVVDGNIVLAWFPFPKPVSISNWLSFIADKRKQSDLGKLIDRQVSPFLEGFYRLALSKLPRKEQGNICSIHFDDLWKTTAEGYFDFGTRSTQRQQQAGYPDEANRVKISASIPLVIQSPADRNATGSTDWRYNTTLSSITFFTIPKSMLACELMDPIRVKLAPRFTKAWISKYRLSKPKGLQKKIINCLQTDAKYNCVDLGVLSHELDVHFLKGAEESQAKIVAVEDESKNGMNDEKNDATKGNDDVQQVFIEEVVIDEGGSSKSVAKKRKNIDSLAVKGGKKNLLAVGKNEAPNDNNVAQKSSVNEMVAGEKHKERKRNIVTREGRVKKSDGNKNAVNIREMEKTRCIDDVEKGEARSAAGKKDVEASEKTERESKKQKL